MAKKLWTSPRIVPRVAYDDVPRAVEWLSRVFGFRERREARLTGTMPGKGRWVLAWMELGEGLFVIGSRAYPGDSHSLQVYVGDIERHFEQAKMAGATIVSEPKDEFWGGRTYQARDHEGRLWEFSQQGRGYAPEDWKLPNGISRG